MSLWNALPTPQACAAEAARTLLRTASTAALHLQTVPGLVAVGGHAGDGEGRLLLPTSADDRVVIALRRAGSLPARAVLTDVAPLPLRSRWRGRLELEGQLAEVPRDDAGAAWQDATGGGELAPGRRVLRLVPQVLVLTRFPDPPVPVCPRAYAAAVPDPLADDEAELLWHLADGHPAEVRQLAGLLPRRVSTGARRIVPLRLDRHALVLRVERDGADLDVPLALRSARARHPAEVVAALRALLDTCPGAARRE